MGRVLCKGRTAVSLFVLTAALAPACGDDDSESDPRRTLPEAGRDARSDAREDAPNQLDSSLDAGSDTGGNDARSGDASDASETSDAARLDGSALDAATDARSDSPVTEAGSDATLAPLDGAVEADATLDALADASDAAARVDAGSPDADSDADPVLDATSAPLVIWRVGQDFACEGTRAQVECSDDDFAEAYVITILQSAGGSCPDGPSRIAVYFQYGSAPAAGEYTIHPSPTFDDPAEARLEVDVNNGAAAWVAQSGQISVEWVEGAPSLTFAGVPARFGTSETTLSGRVTCPPDN
ncbi:MAG TPA: hypothetical protein VI072_33120 [Polyangiaceae bacterium]